MPDSQSIIQKLTSTLPQLGRLEWIGLSPGRRKPIQVVRHATVEVGTGLRGDHHARRGRSKRQVTLIQQEHLRVMGELLGRAPIDPLITRRNLVISGINLIALKGQRFTIGGVLFEGTKPCAPCSRMEEALGPGGYNAMRGHGGLCAVVLEGGEIEVGAQVKMAPHAGAT